MHTRRTIRLNTSSWDLTLDGTGRIAVAHGAEATAQNVANEARLFTNDAYFNQDKGIPYFAMTLGSPVNSAVLRSYLRQAALNVPDVKDVESITINRIDPATRTLAGDMRFTTVDGADGRAITTYF